MESRKEYTRGFNEGMKTAEEEKDKIFTEAYEEGYLDGRKDEREGKKPRPTPSRTS